MKREITHLAIVLCGPRVITTVVHVAAIYISVNKTMMMKYKAWYLRESQYFSDDDFPFLQKVVGQVSTPLSIIKP